MITALAFASVVAVLPAVSLIKPWNTSIVSAPPFAPKFAVAARSVFAVDVSVTVRVVAFVTTAVSTRAAVIAKSAVVPSPSISQLNFEPSKSR